MLLRLQLRANFASGEFAELDRSCLYVAVVPKASSTAGETVGAAETADHERPLANERTVLVAHAAPRTTHSELAGIDSGLQGRKMNTDLSWVI